MATAKKSEAYMPRLKKLYKETVVSELEKDLNLDNVNNVPKLVKIMVTSGTGRNKDNKHYQDCLLYTSPSPRDGLLSRMPSSA